jgi:post-segregation antitoxin (ccd killing protein)
MNISVPDALALEVRRFGIPVSEVAQAALREAVANSRRAKTARLRDSLADAAAHTADTRRGIAEDYPDDARNIQCAESLEALAEHVRNLPDDDAQLGTLLDLDSDRDYFTARWNGENWSRTLYRLGFHGRGVVAPNHALDELLDAAQADYDEIQELMQESADDTGEGLPD